MKKAVLFIFILFFSINLWSIAQYTKNDSLIFEKYIESLKNESQLSLNELVIKTALYFEDSPYKASTLENYNTEQLVVNLREFDCTTLVENSVALAKTLKSNNCSFFNFCRQLQEIRYRKGMVQGYESRLHYITDWAYDNEKKAILTDISRELGGITDAKIINFMSNHPDSYKQLKGNINIQQKIKDTETLINSRKRYSYVKKANITSVADKIHNGDIIVFATSIPGLDYSHMGFAYYEKEKLTFIHASTRQMKVIVDNQSLSEYCKNSSKCTGITILRLNE